MYKQPKLLDLFSGIGGFSLGLERSGMKTVAFCEMDKFCQKVLKKHWPDVPIYNDVRSLDYDGTVDVICGGFPCQPFSVAGKQRGKEDDRHLWPAMFSLIKKHRPSWVVGENVANLINMGIDEVLADLEGEDYTTRAFIIPACAINAHHRRDRVWIIANSNDLGFKQRSEEPLHWFGHLQGELVRSGEAIGIRQHKDEPLVYGTTDGIPKRMDRCRVLGNAVVPQIPEIIGRAIMEVENG